MPTLRPPRADSYSTRFERVCDFGLATSPVFSKSNRKFRLNLGGQYVYVGGGLIAEYTNNTTHFVHTDHLGSTRLVTALNQSVSDNMDYLPYGLQIAGASGTTHKFTGKERDAESGLDNFGARYNASTMGRFMSADPSRLSVFFTNPQSWNR